MAGWTRGVERRREHGIRSTIELPMELTRPSDGVDETQMELTRPSDGVDETQMELTRLRWS